MRFPIILPSDHRVTRLIVRHHHEKSGHGYREAVKNELRQLYHIIHLDATVRKEAAACVWCKVRRNRPKVPRMAPLPVQRLTPNLRPFSFTGVDYIGPFDVTIGRRSEKRWIVLFTCLVVRGIHIEIAHGLTTQSWSFSNLRWGKRWDLSSSYKHLADIPVTGNSQQNPLIVKGLNNIELFAALETRVGNPGEPVAVRSKIGWTIYSVTDSAWTPHVVMNLHRITAMTNRDLHDVLGNHYKLEQMSIPAFEVPIAPDEKRAKDILKRTTKRIGNRFETGLLWRDDNRVFPDSYPTAEKRMQQLAKRLKKNPA